MEIFTDYCGKAVRLTDERRNHILAHPEMLKMEPAVALALSNPEEVRRSKTDPKVYLYYCYHRNTVVGDKWLCVVVKELENDSFIITAYLTDKLKTGEQLWLKA